MTSTEYVTDIRLGERYVEERSGIEGHAVAISFYEHGCERVTLEYFNEPKGEIIEYTFDAPRLTSVATGERAVTAKTGGPARPVPRRGLA